ncbi:hypothetical protein PILCRDRAFT_829708 [Piloderma croceum F 1598]|uniref:Uncharacterized protein n=1 Tax=Piloderma croceum (strain F 1598) TaxID=765440 RepID=A0A0C3AFA4_PILCF|nr:hypothetical protein PILCRDRAFT_829708 [Piloderma croceum F 1598]
MSNNNSVPDPKCECTLFSPVNTVSCHRRTDDEIHKVIPPVITIGLEDVTNFGGGFEHDNVSNCKYR